MRRQLLRTEHTGQVVNLRGQITRKQTSSPDKLNIASPKPDEAQSDIIRVYAKEDLVGLLPPVQEVMILQASVASSEKLARSHVHPVSLMRWAKAGQSRRHSTLAPTITTRHLESPWLSCSRLGKSPEKQWQLLAGSITEDNYKVRLAGFFSIKAAMPTPMSSKMPR